MLSSTPERRESSPLSGRSGHAGRSRLLRGFEPTPGGASVRGRSVRLGFGRVKSDTQGRAGLAIGQAHPARGRGGVRVLAAAFWLDETGGRPEGGLV